MHGPDTTSYPRGADRVQVSQDGLCKKPRACSTGPTCFLHPPPAGPATYTGEWEEVEGKSHTADEVAQAIEQSRE